MFVDNDAGYFSYLFENGKRIIRNFQLFNEFFNTILDVGIVMEQFSKAFQKLVQRFELDGLTTTNALNERMSVV